MKKLVLLMVAFVSATMMNAQISRSTTDSKISEFTKLVTSYTSGQRVDKVKLTTVYNEINCSLTEAQAEALAIDLQNTREEICGSSEFPRTQTVTDASFKKYAEQVAKYLEYKKKTGDK
ncbi:MAG: hypothetical protein ACK5D5_00865 [Bacteroidota bacterium]|jgi:hypothetical protein